MVYLDQYALAEAFFVFLFYFIEYSKQECVYRMNMYIQACFGTTFKLCILNY